MERITLGAWYSRCVDLNQINRLPTMPSVIAMLLICCLTQAVKQKALLKRKDLRTLSTHKLSLFLDISQIFVKLAFTKMDGILSSVQQGRLSGALFKHLMVFESYVPHCSPFE
jgi:hypothetical protein